MKNTLLSKLGLGVIIAAAVFAVPALSFAATYAYVNTSGEVMSMEAATPTTAIATAPGIHPNSGVLLIDNSSNTIVGDEVQGM